MASASGGDEAAAAPAVEWETGSLADAGIDADLVKIGYLVVNEGRWDGRQVESPSWVAASTGVRLPLDSISAYGYQWWVDLEPVAGATTPVPVARGNGGQRIYVVGPLDVVAVVTAGNYNSADSRLSEVAFWQHVLPAVDSVAAGG